MLRTAALAFALCMSFAASLGASTPDWFRAAFLALPVEGRAFVQQELAVVGLYEGEPDAAWGPQTEAALMGVSAYLKANSADGVEPILETQADAARFLREVAEGEWGPYLYGGASENEAHRGLED